MELSRCDDLDALEFTRRRRDMREVSLPGIYTITGTV
jgi:hypothetical protein